MLKTGIFAWFSELKNVYLGRSNLIGNKKTWILKHKSKKLLNSHLSSLKREVIPEKQTIKALQNINDS